VDVLAEIQKWGGGGVIGLAVYCFLKLREQQGAEAHAERADDRDDREQEVDLVEKYKQMNLLLVAEAQEWREKYNACHGNAVAMEAEKVELEQRVAQLESVINGVGWLEEGHITPEALRALAQRQESDHKDEH